MSTVPSVVHTRRVTVVQDPDPALPPALSLLRAEPGEDVPHRLCDTLLGLGAQRLREMDFALRDEMLLRGVWTERDRDGLRHPFDVLLSPRTVDLACLGYLHHVTWQLRQALRRASRILFEYDEAAALLPLSEAERDWLARYRRAPDAENGPRERVFCRLDALARLHAPDWRASLKFVEANVVGVGGLTYAPELASAMLRHVAAPLERLDDELALEPCADPRELLVDDLVEHARSLGVVRERPTVALVDDKTLYTLGGEFGRLAAHFADHPAIRVVYADPRELELARDGVVICHGQAVDLVYRALELRELIELEEAGHDLSAMREAFRQGIVVPSVGGDLEHKSVFELLTSERFTAALEARQRAVCHAHVLWTRLLFERRTRTPQGREVDLVPWVEAHREALVLKPNRGFGGLGVVIGADTEPRLWRDALERALREPRHWVVQAVGAPDLEPAVRLDPRTGTPQVADVHHSVGFFPGRRGLGIFGRCAPGRVVNLCSGGGLAGCLIRVA